MAKRRHPEWYRQQSLAYSARSVESKRDQKVSSQSPATKYKSYILSAQWRAKKIEVLAARGAFCEQCRSPRNLNVHHKTYQNLGNEPLTDLEILCRDCHEKAHGIAAPPHRKKRKRKSKVRPRGF